MAEEERRVQENAAKIEGAVDGVIKTFQAITRTRTRTRTRT